ncbi:hypothetical protein ACFCV3_42100 [Kribbella sp. NPDC056345]|uniref:hypothetical protein n=1 Tax=Kribbella sp. NPDC056345 TaxID=3345789 RepID=UPI0035D71BFD
MFRRKNVLLDTALACVERGILVLPATAAGTPLGATWVGDDAEARALWDVAAPPNLMISSGPAVAVWHLPRVAGAYGKRLYEQERPGVWPPTMKLADGRWLTCTLQPESPLGEQAAGVEYVEPGSPVMIPPSTTEDGRRLTWDGANFPVHPLPTAEAVLSKVLIAEQEHMELYGRLD